MNPYNQNFNKLGEMDKSGSWWDAADIGMSMIPVVGTVWNGGKAIADVARGDYKSALQNAAWAAAGLIPGAGVAAGAAKAGIKGVGMAAKAMQAGKAGVRMLGGTKRIAGMGGAMAADTAIETTKAPDPRYTPQAPTTVPPQAPPMMSTGANPFAGVVNQGNTQRYNAQQKVYDGQQAAYQNAQDDAAYRQSRDSFLNPFQQAGRLVGRQPTYTPRQAAGYSPTV